jgi:hypothetical protein
MATIPVHNVPESKSTETIEQRFRRLEAAWDADTRFLSDVGKIIDHPAFQEILSMGESVIPFMMRDLEKGNTLWVWALRRITGHNPVPTEDAGQSRKMAEAWLRWGRERGYQC